MTKNVVTKYFNYKDKEFKINIKTNLSASEKSIFVKNVCQTLITDKDYLSVIKELIFNWMLVEEFTDCDIFKIIDNNPNFTNDKLDIDIIEDFLNDSNIIEIIISNVDISLIEELRNGVEDNLSYKTGIRETKTDAMVAVMLEMVTNKLSVIDTNKMMDMANKIGNVSGDLTPEKLVDIYVNSDTFKNNSNRKQRRKINKNKNYRNKQSQNK